MFKEYIWDDMLDDTDRTVIRKGGYGKSKGLGRSPAVLVLDMESHLPGEVKEESEAYSRFPPGAGERGIRVLHNINRIIDTARENNVSIVFTKHRGSRLCQDLHKEQGDAVIEKENDSAFSGTSIQGVLTDCRADTLLIMGAGTSTAARATLVDAVTRMYNAAFVEDALFDRIMASHKTACLDVWMKFADIADTKQILKYLGDLQHD